MRGRESNCEPILWQADRDSIFSLSSERGLLQGYLGIWYLYIQQLVQLLMLVNSALNLPIYLCVRQANQLRPVNKPVLILMNMNGGRS